MGRLRFLATCTIFLALSSCGYHFQGRYNPLQQLGVEKIYVMQFRNSTYRPGIEQLFSTAMIREIQKSRSFQLVGSEEEADAVLAGEVMVAESSISSSKSQTISQNKTVDVASEFNATVQCAVSLVDRAGRNIFTQVVASNKIYPGANELGSKGATVPLINESEQRLAIQFLASQMMASVYQRMIDTF